MGGSETERPENVEQTSGQPPGDHGRPDIFETRDSLESEANGEATVGTTSSDDVPLPVELASLSDR